MEKLSWYILYMLLEEKGNTKQVITALIYNGNLAKRYVGSILAQNVE